MKKCPDCGVRFYESSATKIFSEKKNNYVYQCPRCGSTGPFKNVEVEDLWV